MTFRRAVPDRREPRAGPRIPDRRRTRRLRAPPGGPPRGLDRLARRLAVRHDRGSRRYGRNPGDPRDLRPRGACPHRRERSRPHGEGSLAPRAGLSWCGAVLPRGGMRPSGQRLGSTWASHVDGEIIDAGCGPGQWTKLPVEPGRVARGVDLVTADRENRVPSDGRPVRMRPPSGRLKSWRPRPKSGLNT